MLKGKTIKLVPLEKDDLPTSLSWANDEHIKSKILRVLPVTRLDQEKWYEDIVQNPSKIVFAIKTVDSEKHIGNIGLYDIDWIHRRAEFWVLIGEPESRGQAIGKEVMELIQEYAFSGLNLNKLYLKVGTDNELALALYEKTGFIQEGVLRHQFFINGEYLDVITNIGTATKIMPN